MDIGLILKYKNIFASLIVVLVVLFAAKNIYTGYLNKEEKLNNQEKSIEDVKVLAGNLERIDKNLKDMKEKIFNGDIFDFKRFLEHAAKESKVAINSFTPRTIKTIDSYNKVKVTIDITADYKGLTNLIHAIEDTASATIIRLERRKQSGHYLILFYVVLK